MTNMTSDNITNIISSDFFIDAERPMLASQQCYIAGYINDTAELRKTLQLTQSHTRQDVLNAAVKRWGIKVNQYLVGDYVLVWFEDNKLLVTSAARASLSLFWQQQEGFSLATHLTQFDKPRQLNQAKLLQQLVLGPLCDSQSCFDGIHQLQPGETLLWLLFDNAKKKALLLKQEQLPLPQQLELTQQVVLPKSTTVVANSDINRHQLFNALPPLAHQLGEPVADAVLAEFAAAIAECKEEQIMLDSSWLEGRSTLGEAAFADSHRWCKKIVKRQLLKNTSKVQERQNTLKAAFVLEQNPLDFSQWLDLHYVLPAWCQLLQRIAQQYGKTLINPFIRPERAKALPRTKQNRAATGYFDLLQVSICNVYDAMQRLMRNGDALTHQLFYLVPPATAKFIQQSRYRPRYIEQVCIQLLTLDYLVKFRCTTMNNGHQSNRGTIVEP